MEINRKHEFFIYFNENPCYIYVFENELNTMDLLLRFIHTSSGTYRKGLKIPHFQNFNITIVIPRRTTPLQFI